MPSVATKAPRVIEYKKTKKVDAVGDITGQLGYAIGLPIVATRHDTNAARRGDGKRCET